MAKLLRQLGWVWVGLLSGDGDYGKFGIQLLLQELQGSGVCVAYSEVIPKVRPHSDDLTMYTLSFALSFSLFHSDSPSLLI